jgi:hypothetical protein
VHGNPSLQALNRASTDPGFASECAVYIEMSQGQIAAGQKSNLGGDPLKENETRRREWGSNQPFSASLLESTKIAFQPLLERVVDRFPNTAS